MSLVGSCMTPQPCPAGSSSSLAAGAKVAVSGGVWRRAGVALVMSPRGPKVLYRKRFLYQKWCELVTPRYQTRIFLFAPMHSSGRVASFCHTTFGLDRSRSAGILGQSRMVSWLSKLVPGYRRAQKPESAAARFAWRDLGSVQEIMWRARARAREAHARRKIVSLSTSHDD